MTKVRIMYWKEIPVSVQAEDQSGRVSRVLDSRFQQGADAIAMFDGSGSGDEYLMGWEWGNAVEMPGSAKEVAERCAVKIEERFPTDFIARIRDMHASGTRVPKAGAVDHWIN